MEIICTIFGIMLASYLEHENAHIEISLNMIMTSYALHELRFLSKFGALDSTTNDKEMSER